MWRRKFMKLFRRHWSLARIVLRLICSRTRKRFFKVGPIMKRGRGQASSSDSLAPGIVIRAPDKTSARESGDAASVHTHRHTHTHTHTHARTHTSLPYRTTLLSVVRPGLEASLRSAITIKIQILHWYHCTCLLLE